MMTQKPRIILDVRLLNTEWVVGGRYGSRSWQLSDLFAPFDATTIGKIGDGAAEAACDYLKLHFHHFVGRSRLQSTPCSSRGPRNFEGPTLSAHLC